VKIATKFGRIGGEGLDSPDIREVADASLARLKIDTMTSTSIVSIRRCRSKKWPAP
jgi:aryl-alcohol dehydrogenase-like predicted oxidoreductase